MKVARIPAALLIATLRAYKRVVSPFFLPACRYTPTCSEYAMEAVDRHGAIRGSVLAAGRLLRCHPFVHGGHDPVPLRSHVHVNSREAVPVIGLWEKQTAAAQQGTSPVRADENSPALQRWGRAKRESESRRDDRLPRIPLRSTRS